MNGYLLESHLSQDGEAVQNTRSSFSAQVDGMPMSTLLTKLLSSCARAPWSRVQHAGMDSGCREGDNVSKRHTKEHLRRPGQRSGYPARR